MPTYEYKCQTCDKQFEIQASMHDPRPTQGPQCEGPCQLQKCLSRVFAQVAGAHPAPVEKPLQKNPPEAASHVCSKYCDLHK